MKITLGNKSYDFLKGYQKESAYRCSLNQQAGRIFGAPFGIAFEKWHEAGYWNANYIPYTLFDQEIAIANVSVNIMDFNTFGTQQRYIQLGTIFTDEKYRHKNLSKFLMEMVMEEWAEKCAFIYLYANNTVLNFYPKFGFEPVREYEYFKSINKNSACNTLEKLNMDLQYSRDKLYEYAKNSTVFGKLSMQENADLVMFYGISFLKEHIYYIKSLDAIAVAIKHDRKIHLWDIFSNNALELDSVLDSLVHMNVDEIALGFTPEDCGSYQTREFLGEDTLFIQQGKASLFNDNKIMFPLLSHA